MTRMHTLHTVVPLKHNSIYDLMDLARRICRNVKVTLQGERNTWVKVVRVTKEMLHTVLIKEDLNRDFEEI